MKIFRYSNDGFNPQYQDYHYNQVLLDIDDDWFYNDYFPKCPEHLKNISIKLHEDKKPFFEENINDFKYGIWVFTSRHHSKQALNHLNLMPKLWSAEIPDDTMVYDVDFKNKYLIGKCPGAEYVGCYIPEKELINLKNIKEINYYYEGKFYKDFYKYK